MEVIELCFINYIQSNLTLSCCISGASALPLLPVITCELVVLRFIIINNRLRSIANVQCNLKKF